MDQRFLLLLLRVPLPIPPLKSFRATSSGTAVSLCRPLCSNPKSSRSFFFGRARLKSGIISARGGGGGGGGGGGRKCKCASKSKVKSDCCCEELASAESGSESEWKSEFEYVEVIGIGSRKDAVLDFCLDSDFHSSPPLLRFWNIHCKDSQNVQLQERFSGRDLNPGNVEASQFLETCSKAVILVASAGYGTDHVTAIDILKNTRSTNGFVVAIFLRPFSFEGQRRQAEVKILIEKLQAHTNFCIDIDTDLLLKKDLVTLDEALNTANTAVLLAIDAISVLLSEKHQKLLDVPNDNVQELEVSDVIKILENHKEAKIGFGAADGIKNSLLLALYDCPFIGTGVEDLSGIVICIITSSDLVDDRDVHASLKSFRQTTGYMGKLIISTMHDPSLEANMLVATVVVLSSTPSAHQKDSILSRLAHHFPLIFKLLKRHRKQYDSSDENKVDNSLEDVDVSEVLDSSGSRTLEKKTAVESIGESIEQQSEELGILSSSYFSDNSRSKTRAESSYFYDPITEGYTWIQREPLSSRNLGPGYQIAQEWAKERAEANPKLDELCIFSQPVGIRPLDELKESPNISYPAELTASKIDPNAREQPLISSSIYSWGALTEAGFIAVKDFYHNASTLLKGKKADVPEKQGVLSIRAASMLESERDSPKKWNPLMEMNYRGGVYKGQCQGGLPEGKGRLILGDRSIYDGMWHYGKRSGAGAFYFSNGDVFQGSWRDDLMHGKGWVYFHNGDRWFANFWKGKANGESRFYSKSGDVFFGNFQDGWRHGHFLCIDVFGERCVEMWEMGVLVSRKQLDPEDDA